MRDPSMHPCGTRSSTSPDAALTRYLLDPGNQGRFVAGDQLRAAEVKIARHPLSLAPGQLLGICLLLQLLRLGELAGLSTISRILPARTSPIPDTEVSSSSFSTISATLR
jgi:hypothetical protein